MSAFTCRAGKTLDHKRASPRRIISYLPYFKYTRLSSYTSFTGPPFDFPLGLPSLLLFVRLTQSDLTHIESSIPYK